MTTASDLSIPALEMCFCLSGFAEVTSAYPDLVVGLGVSSSDGTGVDGIKI